MQDQPDGLISVLLDQSARDDERDDAAMDLASYNEPKVQQALLSALKNEEPGSMVAESIAVSIAEIWIRRDTFDEPDFYSLPSHAQKLILTAIQDLKPDWLEKYRLQ